MKIKKIAVLMMSLSVFVVSCNKEEKQNERDFSQSELVLQLKNVNAELMSTRPQTKMTNRQAANVAWADLSGAGTGAKAGWKIGKAIGTAIGNPVQVGTLGAIVGGVGFAAVMSWMAWPENPITENPSYDDMVSFEEAVMRDYDTEVSLTDLFEDIDVISGEDEEEVKGRIFVEMNSLEEVALSPAELMVGEKHNLMLAFMQGIISPQTPTTSNKRASKREFPGEVELGMSAAKRRLLVKRILQSDTMRQEYNQMLSTESLGEDGTLPGLVSSLYGEVFKEYPDSVEDVVYLVNQYTSLIDASNELTDDEKTCIKHGMSVSLYSFNYWSKNQ